MTSTEHAKGGDVAATRPAGNSGYFLAVGSTRIAGHRFVWGQELPATEGAALAERGYAVQGAEQLRYRNGDRRPAPATAGQIQEVSGQVLDTGARLPDDESGENTVETVGRDGVQAEGSMSRTAVNDSQSGPRTTRRK